MYDKRGDDDPLGTLLITDSGITLVAPEGLTTVPWAKTVSVRRDDKTLYVQRRDRQTPHEFIFRGYRDALIGAFVAERLWRTSSPAKTKRRRSVRADDSTLPPVV
jgi:hypothetical protein